MEGQTKIYKDLTTTKKYYGIKYDQSKCFHPIS